MALSTYDNLKAEIAAQVSRSDLTSSSTSIDTFIGFAEAKFNKKLRVLRMEDDLALTTVAGTETVNLPTDCLEIKYIGYTSAPKDIDYMATQSFKKIQASAYSGRPVGCTLVWSGSLPQLKFVGTPDAAYDLEGIYYAKIPALSSSNTTNWLLTDYPELYLNTCLYYAFRRFRNPLAGEYLNLSEMDIKTLNEEDEKIKTIGGGLRTRVMGTIV